MDQLDALHGLVAESLAARLRSGEATAADFSAAIKFLKDNGIEQPAIPGSPTDKLISSLPFAAEGISH